MLKSFKIWLKIVQIVFLGCLLGVSCSKTTNKELPQIDLSPTAFEQSVKQNLSAIATKVEYILLETTDEVVLTGIQNGKHCFFDSHILISNSGQLYLFDDKGNYLNKIGAMGNGPGERSRAIIAQVLIKDKLIAVYDRIKRKVFFYDYGGIFVSKIDIDFKPSSFFTFNRHLIFMNSQFSRKETDYHVLTIMTKEGVLVKRLLHRPDEEKEEGKRKPSMLADMLPNASTMNVLDDKLYFIESNIEQYKLIWELSEEFEIKHKITMDIGDNVRPLKEYENINATFFKYNRLYGYIESSNYTFFKMMWGNHEPSHASIYYDKEKQEFLYIRKVDAFQNMFINDIDGGRDFYPFWRVSESKVATPLSVLRMRKWLKKNDVSDRKLLNPEGRKDLENIISNAKDTDNPIIMMVTLKE